MSVIIDIQGFQVLDSRGVPALRVALQLQGGAGAKASVPSGASTGANEALELRDQDPSRWHGKGLLKALEHLKALNKEIKHHNFKDQAELDTFLIKWDGTPNKSRVGANTILAVSLAYAKATAYQKNQELFELFAPLSYMLPVPLINVLNGGAHASNSLDTQEFMIVPFGFSCFKEAIRASGETFYCLKNILKKQNLSTNVGDEGGFAPQLKNNEQALQLLLQAIEQAGYEQKIALAVDVAASELYKNGQYLWEKEYISYSDLISIYQNWRDKYPLISIEDGLSDQDWTGWQALTKALGHNTQLVGDDLFVTQLDFLKKGIAHKAGNALLAKMNQVGTVSETQLAIQLAQKNHYAVCLSHRSGETEDTSIADLSVAWQTGQIKTGSLCRGERVAKYNRLLEIETKLTSAEFASKKPFPFLA